MTTKVTVSSSGACYPARLIKTGKDGAEMENHLIASGNSVDTWVGSDQAVTVTEEYHAAGYPAPDEAKTA